MRIAIVGADGQLGSDLVATLCGEDVISLCLPDFDVTAADETREALERLRPAVLINTAAYHRVDECEDNPEKSFEVNALAVRNLAVLASELGFVLVHFSSDYVFDGARRRPYVEGDPPNPLNVYGVSKLAGEFFIRARLEKYFLIRTCGLFGCAGSREKGYNFVDRMIELAEGGRAIRVVNDQWVTPTATAELAERVAELIGTPHYGLFHMTSEGECTWFEFAQEIFRLLGRNARLEPVDTASFGAKARRPLYSVLENRRAKEIGLRNFSPWQEALKTYLKTKGYL
jgi:dTDP-4-dehydrorhamnose reductase